MREIYSCGLIAFAFFVPGGRALPQRNPQATYSVVNVGGDSTVTSEPPKTIYATDPATPPVVSEVPATVTISLSSETTTTETWRVTIGGTSILSPATVTIAYSPSALPVVAETDTIYYSEPLKTATPIVTSSSTTSSGPPSIFKSALPHTFSRWNSSVSSQTRSTAHGSVTYKSLITGGTHASSGLGTRQPEATAYRF